eukprot:539269-Prorocentrum_minimum.AAC.1
MEQVHVDVVGAQTLQAALAVLADVERGYVAPSGDLGRDDELLATAFLLGRGREEGRVSTIRDACNVFRHGAARLGACGCAVREAGA